MTQPDVGICSTGVAGSTLSAAVYRRVGGGVSGSVDGCGDGLAADESGRDVVVGNTGVDAVGVSVSDCRDSSAVSFQSSGVMAVGMARMSDPFPWDRSWVIGKPGSMAAGSLSCSSGWRCGRGDEEHQLPAGVIGKPEAVLIEEQLATRMVDDTNLGGQRRNVVSIPRVAEHLMVGSELDGELLEGFAWELGHMGSELPGETFHFDGPVIDEVLQLAMFEEQPKQVRVRTRVFQDWEEFLFGLVPSHELPVMVQQIRRVRGQAVDKSPMALGQRSVGGLGGQSHAGEREQVSSLGAAES